MKRTATPATLFDPPQAAYDVRLKRFAREVATRHRGHAADVGALVAALRAYHAMWTLFELVPPLDATAIAAAVAEYQRARGSHRGAAA